MIYYSAQVSFSFTAPPPVTLNPAQAPPDEVAPRFRWAPAPEHRVPDLLAPHRSILGLLLRLWPLQEPRGSPQTTAH